MRSMRLPAFFSRKITLGTVQTLSAYRRPPHDAASRTPVRTLRLGLTLSANAFWNLLYLDLYMRLIDLGPDPESRPPDS
jgi:hypothetical protein